MSTTTRPSQIVVNRYDQAELDFSRVKSNPQLLDVLRKNHDSYHRRLKKLQDETWDTYCQTWTILEGLLETEGLGWCPVSLAPIKLIDWTIAYIDFRRNYDVNLGGGFHDTRAERHTALFEVPDYSVFVAQLPNIPLFRLAQKCDRPYSDKYNDSLSGCCIGNLFADFDRDQAWRFLLDQKIPLANVSHAPAELYTQYDLVKPEQTGRLYGRYLRRYPRA